MKTRLFLLLLAAGSLCWLLIWMQQAPAPSGEKPASTEIPKPVVASASTNRVMTPSPPTVTGSVETNSSRSEILDLMQRIQAALLTGELADHDLVFTNLLLALIQKDPRSAASLAESMEAGPLREEMLRRVAQNWTAQDPAGARQWAEQLSDEGERNSALTDVCFQVAQGDPRQATQLANQYGLGNLPGATLENLVQQWAAKDLTSATAWVKERPAGEQRDQMLSRVALVLAETRPAQAAQMVVDQIPAGDAQTEAAVSVLHQWGLRDLPGARAWVELFPESPLRERALNELAGIEEYQNALNKPE